MTDTPAPAPDESLGRAIAERQRPLRQRRCSIAGLAQSPGRPGVLGRRSTSFSLGAGLSLSVRQQMGLINPDPDVSWLPVAPPAEWDESLFPEQVRTGDPTLDRIIAAQRSAPSATTPPIRRGLRSTAGRRNTAMGRNTAPGASAHRLRPQAAPPSLSPDVRRMVSGDGDPFGLAASRSAGGGAATGARPSSRAPSSPTGRRARARVERSAPWQHHSAQALAPQAGWPSGPVSMSGRSLNRTLGHQPTPNPAVSARLAPNPTVASTLSPAPNPAPNLHPASNPTHHQAPHSQLREMAPDSGTFSRSSRVSGLPVGAPAVSGAPVGAGGGAAALDLAATVAAIANDVAAATEGYQSFTGLGSSAMASATSVPRGARPLVPSVRGPGTNGSRQPSISSTQRMAQRHRPGSTAPAPAPAPASVGVSAFDAAFPGASPMVGPALQARANQAAIAAGMAAPMGSPALAAAVTSPAGAALTSSHAASGSAGSPGSVAAGRAGTLSASTSVAAGSGRTTFEPALAAMLRAEPPSLALASRPRRSFTIPGSSPSTPASAPGSVSSMTPFPSGFGRPVVAGSASSPAMASASAGSTLVASPLSGFGRPVGAASATSPPMAGSVAAAMGSTAPPALVASSAETPAQTAASRSSSQAVSTRGLGSVAALLTTPASAPVGTAAAGQAAAASSAPHAHAHARRTVRTLPSLAIPTSSPQPLATAAATQPAAPGIPRIGTAPAVAPPPAAAIDPGERFDQVLAQHAGPTLTKLPQRFEPIARAILPDSSKVRLSMGHASRQALAAVGKKAATAGDVVHLAQPLDQSRRSIEILAHELTHVANPSPLVRFLDDDRDSSEERQARAMEALMRQAPVGTPPASPPPARTSPTPAGTSNGSSHGPAGSLSPTDSGGGDSAGSDSGAGSPSPARAGAYGRAMGTSGSNARTWDSPSDPDPTTETPTAPQIDIDRLLDALEARVIRELERRGRRWPRPL